jgi:hypothetical protein
MVQADDTRTLDFISRNAKSFLVATQRLRTAVATVRLTVATPPDRVVYTATAADDAVLGGFAHIEMYSSNVSVGISKYQYASVGNEMLLSVSKRRDRPFICQSGQEYCL